MFEFKLRRGHRGEVNQELADNSQTSSFLLLPLRSLLAKLRVSTILFFRSPRRNPRRQIAARACDVFDFGYAAIARRFPNLPHPERAVFPHDPAQMMNCRCGSGFADSIPRAA